MAISKRSKVKYPFVKDTLGLWFQASLNRCRDRSFGSVEWHLLMMNVSTVVLVVIVACRAVTIPLPVPSPDEKMGGRYDNRWYRKFKMWINQYWEILEISKKTFLKLN